MMEHCSVLGLAHTIYSINSTLSLFTVYGGSSKFIPRSSSRVEGLMVSYGDNCGKVNYSAIPCDDRD